MLNENTDARDIYVTRSAMFLLESKELFIALNGRFFGKTYGFPLKWFMTGVQL